MNISTDPKVSPGISSVPMMYTLWKSGLTMISLGPVSIEAGEPKYTPHIPSPVVGFILNVKVSFCPVVNPFEFDTPVAYMKPLGSMSKAAPVS